VIKNSKKFVIEFMVKADEMVFLGEKVPKKPTRHIK